MSPLAFTAVRDDGPELDAPELDAAVECGRAVGRRLT